jgi:hypothetical protein
MNSLISLELIERLTWINNKIASGELTHPARFALFLEDLATDAPNEARALGEATWAEAEDLQPSRSYRSVRLY